MSETDISLTIGLDTTSADKTAEQLQKEIKQIFQTRGDGAQSASLTQLELQMKKNVESAEKLRETLGDLYNAKGNIEIFNEGNQSIIKMGDTIDAIKAKINELQSTKVDFLGEMLSADEIEARGQQIEDKIAEVSKVISEYQGRLNNDKFKLSTLEASGGPENEIEYYRNNAEYYAQAIQELMSEKAQYEQELDAFDQALEQSGRKVDSLTTQFNGQEMTLEQLNAILASTQNEYDAIRDTLTQLESSNPKIGDAEYQAKVQQEINNTEMSLDGVNDKLKQQIIRYAELENKGVKPIRNVNREMQNLKTTAERTRKSLKSTSSSMSHGFGGLSKTIKGLVVKFGVLFLGVRGLMSMFMRIRSAILQGFSNLRESGVGKLKKQMNDLTNACTTLKNALAGAFEPIVTTIIPYIQRLVEWLTIAIDKLAQFIAAMKGQTTYIKAIKQVGNAGEKASKQLAKFDELNVLDKKGNGAAGMFEEAKISDEMLDRVAELKKKIQEIKDWLEKYIFKPVKDFIAWFVKPITDNIDKIKQALYNLYLMISDILGWIREKINHTLGVFKEVYDEYIKPSLDKLMAYVSYIFGKILDFWNRHYEEIKWIIDQFKAMWDESVQPLIDEGMRLLGALFALVTDFVTSGDVDSFFAGLEVYWNWWYPKLQTAILMIRIIAKHVSDFILTTMQNARRGADVIRQAIEKVGGGWEFLKLAVVKGIEFIHEKLNQLLEDIHTIRYYGEEEFGILIYMFESPFTVAINLVKSAFNSLKETVQQVIDVIKNLLGIDFTGSALYQALSVLNSSNVSNLLKSANSTANSGKIRRVSGMASGGVIPPNASKHLVMVGDNNHETEVVSPLSTMQDAMINALQSVGLGGAGQPINIYLGTEKIYSEIRKLEKRNTVMGG